MRLEKDSFKSGEGKIKKPIMLLLAALLAALCVGHEAHADSALSYVCAVSVSALNSGGESTESAPPVGTTSSPFAFALGDVSGEAGSTLALPLTLNDELSTGVTAIRFDLEFDSSFLTHEQFIDPSAIIQVNKIKESPRKYTIVVGSSLLTMLPESIGAIKLHISPDKEDQESTYVRLSQIVVVDAHERSVSLPDANALITVIADDGTGVNHAAYDKVSEHLALIGAPPGESDVDVLDWLLAANIIRGRVMPDIRMVWINTEIY